jgi:response regulator RpfG family c-di-GMP phosphodiesterase
MQIIKKILVADEPDGQSRVKRALSERYALRFAANMHEAESMLRASESKEETGSNFDMVISGVRFNESRMFELLQFVRSQDHFERLPFLIISIHNDRSRTTELIRTSSSLLGACQLLELKGLTEFAAATLLLDTVDSSFGKTVKRERADVKSKKRG